MAILDILKETLGTVLEAAKENPVAAAGIAAGAATLGGGAVYLRNRSKKKKAAVLNTKRVQELRSQVDAAVEAGHQAAPTKVAEAAKASVMHLDTITDGAVLKGVAN